MALFFFNKLLWSMATLLVASILVFVALEIVPGDPAQVMLGVNATDEAVAALRKDLGIDRPALQRYFVWVGGMLTGDFGKSYTYAVPVRELVAERAVVQLFSRTRVVM